MSLDGLELKVETKAWARMLDDWSIEAGYSAVTALKKRARLLIKRLMISTPPIKSYKNATRTDGQLESAREEAKKRISRALRKVFFVSGTDIVEHVGSVYGVSNVDAWYTNKQGYKYNFRFESILLNQESINNYFRLNKSNNGKIKKGWRVYKGRTSTRIQAKAAICATDYINQRNKIYNNLGRQRASWAVSYMDPRIGGGEYSDYRIPNWVKVHMPNARGQLDTSRLSGSNPEIVIRNDAHGIGRIKHFLPIILKIEQEAMHKDMFYYRKGIKERHDGK